MSADIGWLHDAKLLQLYIRLYEQLPYQQRDLLRTEQTEWLKLRNRRADAAIESHGGTLAPLGYNLEFIKATKGRVSEFEARLKSFEMPATA